MDFYRDDIALLINRFYSDTVNGLSDEKIIAARLKYGKNLIKTAGSRPILLILFRQFTSPLIFILLAAALAAFFLQESGDGLILLIIVVMNALIGFYQEWKSENILASIKNLVVEKCTVVREGKMKEIFSEDLVPGDLVVLTEGTGVPADIRLTLSTGFSVNEFILTGESLPSSKDHTVTASKNLTYSDIRNSVFMGTTVARGNARGIVCATGMETEIGKISATSRKIKSSDAPIQKEVKDIAKKLSYATIFIAILLFATRLLLHDTITMALIFSISVAAAMVPEGLPAQISMALALAVTRLARKNAIVKKIASAQTLGSATVIASDKTGTITKNEMTITGCYFNGMTFSVSGTGYMPQGEIMDAKGSILKKETLGELKIFFLSGFLSSTGKINPPDNYHKGWYCIGDPTESSFATLAMKAGYSLDEVEKDYTILQSFDFDSYRRRATIIRSHKGKTISFVKGSLETVLSVCSSAIINGAVTTLTEVEKKGITTVSTAFAENALRVIAIAYKDLDDKKEYTIEEAESDLVYAGFVTMLDPPHESVKAAIESVFKARIKVFMITGDNEVTARAIAKSIGLMNENNQFPVLIKGELLQHMTDEELCKQFSARAVIFSRVSPSDKFRIVDLLKKQGEIVAVTGDGVNDTLSLKRADIGVAMGLNGSKVAQDAANIVLLDDNFATIVLAVKEGRTIFRNLEKTIKTNLSSNIAELTCVLAGFAGAFGGIATPILAVQILLIDMVGEMFPLIMLTYDPPEKRMMEMAPRNPATKILTKHSIMSILFNGSIMGIASYGAFLLAYFGGNVHEANHYEKAITVTFVSIIFSQYANLLSRRSFGPVWSRYLFANKQLLIAFGISISAMLLFVYLPLFNQYFHTAPLKLFDWLLPLSAGTICLLAYEFIKWKGGIER